MTATTDRSPRKPGRAKRAKDFRIADIADPVLRARLYGLSETMLEKVERILEALAPASLDDPRAPPVPPSILRWSANLMALWHLCPHEACRRARCCRRNATTCVMRGTDRVPADVRKGAAALLRGRRDGLPYEDVRAAARDDVAAVELWLSAARTSPTPRRRTRGAPLTAKSG
jgi:hypothetical protein